MQFTRLTKENISVIKKYLDKSEISFCDISIGAKFMWRDEYVIDFCVLNDTLIMKEKGPDYDGVFYYPMGADVLGGLSAIENYCRENFLPLSFCCIDDAVLKKLSDRYYDISYYNERDWDDYIYTAEQFKTYAGKKLSGQRNHVNKFKKLYPNYSFAVITKSDIPDIIEFLDEYIDASDKNPDRISEVEMTKEFLLELDELNQLGGVIRIDGKIIALSIGEIVGDTLIVHVEKALTSFNGAYPLMAQEFAKAFADERVKYINREEDCGELGLRQSKLQYKPIEVKRKIAVTVKTLFDRLPSSLALVTDRLEITEIRKIDKQRYFALYTDDELNKWWGYDYREDLDGEPTSDWFFEFQNSLKAKKEEFSFAVRVQDEMVGELVLHNFDYFGGVEMGFRFFKSCHGKGYATESALKLKEFVKIELNAKILKSRCFKQNIPSKNLIGRLGLSQTHESDTHYFFQTEL